LGTLGLIDRVNPWYFDVGKPQEHEPKKNNPHSDDKKNDIFPTQFFELSPTLNEKIGHGIDYTLQYDIILAMALFSNKKEIDTDPQKIEELLTRSIATIYPTPKALEERLKSGVQQRIYVGIDPTATYVHLGHATNYLILKRLHDLGHKIIVLIGDFTAMIGDPSDKTALRKHLTKEEVLENVKTFKEQIGKILDFEDTDNPIEFQFNSEWLSKLNFSDLADLASYFTVQQMLERDNFEKRIKENKPLYVHEFFYPLMQGYDSVALKADIEIGGTDQTFNMLAGRTLVKKYQNREKIVITTTLLENPVTGEKLMSKSLGTGIGLDESVDNMFGKTMAMPDTTIIQLFIDCTELSMEEIKSIQIGLEEKKNFRDAKIRLAKEIVGMYHGKESADKAAENFEKTFSDGGIPENIEVLEVIAQEMLGDILVSKGIVESKTDFKRLVSEGAVINMDKNMTIIDWNTKALEGTYKIGKRRFVRIEKSN
jgi:tyrosyl-tRNA synthetase